MTVHGIEATLYKWNAKRAGGRITVYHSAGKISHIDTITVDGDGNVIATNKDGKRYCLAV